MQCIGFVTPPPPIIRKYCWFYFLKKPHFLQRIDLDIRLCVCNIVCFNHDSFLKNMYATAMPYR